MKRTSSYWLIIAVSLTGSVSSADDTPADESKELEGTWRFVAAESVEEGWDQPLELVRKWVWWIRDTDIHGPGPVPGFRDATFRLDPEESPKAIDLSYLDGTTLQGIYKLEANRRNPDRLNLIICLRSKVDAERGRPEEFLADGEAGLSLLILEKVTGN